MKLLPFVFVLLCTSAVVAQCTNPWQSCEMVSGTNGVVRAIAMWDPDGPGPAAPLQVVAGDFTFAGTTPASHIAAFDAASGTWLALRSGTNGIVRSLATLPSGELIVGGDFTSAGGVPASCIAMWNGSTWAAMGSGFDQSVRAVHVRPNGELIAGGLFTLSGGTALPGLARWNGTAWVGIGTSAPGWVVSLTSRANGDLFVGYFRFFGAGPTLTMWNGSVWSTLSSGTPGYGDLQVSPNGDLFARAGSTATIVRWSAGSWSSLPPPMGAGVGTFTVLPNGDVVATASVWGTPNVPVVRWNGTAWVPFAADLPGTAQVLHALPNGDVLAGGEFVSRSISYFARWDGVAWRPAGDLGVSPSGAVAAFCTTAAGDLVAAGSASVTFVTTFDGQRWQDLGNAIAMSVNVLARLPSGDLVAGGAPIGGGPAVFRWDGAVWSPLGNQSFGNAPTVASMVVMPNGDLVVGGQFLSIGSTPCLYIARWNGTAWSPIGAGLMGYVHALVVLPNGDLIAGGDFTTDGGGAWLGRCARWNGSTWSSVGPGFDGSVGALVVRPNGDLIAGGTFNQAGGVSTPRIARWNGSWTNIGSIVGSSVGELAVLPDGDVVAAGYFASAGGVTVNNIARWNGATWAAFGSGTDQPVSALASDRRGDLWVGGWFHDAGGIGSRYVARLTTTCPATAAVGGAGCAGSGGANVLTPMTLPWLGSTFRSRASGLPALGFAIHVLGLQPMALPLPAILPQGVPGCQLWAQPDLLELLLPVAGVADIALALPASLAFVGFTYEQQVVALELDATGAIVSLTSTNSLHVRKGHF